jgi:hypothetical protein
VNQARAVMALSAVATQTSAKATAWKSGSAQIVVPSATVPVDVPVTLSVSGVDLTGARVVWEARDQEPAFGKTYTISPKNNGAQWVELEIEWPDGRRVFAEGSFNANSAVVTWLNSSLPTGAQTFADNGDGWNWIPASNSPPFSATKVHQSNLASGLHEHWFENATATVQVSTGDKMFAYVYLDPVNPPKEIMLMWNDGSWEHRAYWGGNLISYGDSDSAGRRNMGPLPATGQWVRLEVPASAVNLEGRSVKGMGFTLFDGRATWGPAGRAAP